MTYGQVITRITSEAGMIAVYPRLLDETAIGFPVIQYRETDWEFIRRLASRFGMAVYPETTLGGGKLTVDLPQTGNAGELRCLSYTVRIDRKFYQVGGEQEGRSREQYRTYEVRSMELRRVGDAVAWDGTQLNEKTLKMCQQEPSSFYKIIGMRKTLADNSYRAKRGNCVFDTDMPCTKLLSCFRY